MPKFILLSGLPCSGKSTFRHRLAGYAGISSDDYIEQVADQAQITYNEAFKDAIKNVDKYMNDVLTLSINNYKDIIWDQTNLSRKKRKMILDKIPSTYNKISVHFKNDFKSILSINELRKGKRIPVEVLRSMQFNEEIPSLDEGFEKCYVIENYKNLLEVARDLNGD